MSGLFGGPVEGTDQPVGVQVDVDDEVVPITSDTVPHIGCLEIKVLKGTDGRTYALEAMRLTPRDANYVKGSKSTGNLSVEAQAQVDANIATTYVLRQELITVYANQKFETLRHELMTTEMNRQRALEAEKNPPAIDGGVNGTDEAVKSIENKEPDAVKGEKGEKGEWFREESSPAPTPVKGGKPQPDTDDNTLASIDKKDETAVATTESEADRGKYFEEMQAKLQAMSIDNVGIVLNANCFIDGFECDVDPEVALKDEDQARLLADFLYKQVTPRYIRYYYLK
jgi:hypothetical protein